MKPSRSASNGREAVSGSGFRVRACIWEKADSVSGRIEASVPPAMHTSAIPSRIQRAPSPTAWPPAAQAVVMQAFGPVKPKAMATWPAAAFGMSCGTMNGLTRSGPFSRKILCWISRLERPPIPVENMTAVRAGSTWGSPASSHASREAATAKCATQCLKSASRSSLVN